MQKTINNTSGPKNNLIVANASGFGVRGSGNEINGDEKGKFVKEKNRKMAKFKNLVKSKNYDYFSKSKNIKTSNESDFFIVETRLVFTKLK